MNGTIFILDPGEPLLQTINSTMLKEKFKPVVVSGRASTLRRIAEERPNILMICHGNSGGAGLHIAHEARKIDYSLSVVVIMKSPHSKLVNAALKYGAYHILPPPLDMMKLQYVVRKAYECNILHRCFSPRDTGRQPSSSEAASSILIGISPAMTDTWNMVARLARSNAAVLVEGESGSGKELIARAVHNASSRANKSFVTVNCGRLDVNTAESELFGHTQGAYTGAMKGRAGLFEQSHSGTLFLDEISEMPLDVQVKLLRVLESGRFRRMGGNQTVSVDVRLIFASNKNLQECVSRGEFREDLFHRINMLPIKVPPLRERREDIVPLAWHFINADTTNGLENWEITEEALSAIRSYNWPGNVRELRNTMRRACILATDRVITPDLLPFHAAKVEVPNVPPPSLQPSSLPLWVVERAHIQQVLNMVNGNKSRAAVILEIDRKTLYSKLEKYGLLPGRIPERLSS
jgi:two-component system NtrC family response regulator